MVMTPNVARGSIIVGSIGLVVATTCFLLGIVTSQLLSGHPSASAGFWSSVFIVPGILSIIAGKYNNTTTMAFALVFGIIATIVAAIGTVYCVAFWIILSSFADHDLCNDNSYDLNCSKVKLAVAVIATLTILMAILSVTSLTSSILGCLGTCCAPSETVIIHTISQPSTVVVSSQSNSQYHPMAPHNPNWTTPQLYTGPPPPHYGVQKASMVSVGDDVPLLENV